MITLLIVIQGYLSQLLQLQETPEETQTATTIRFLQMLGGVNTRFIGRCNAHINYKGNHIVKNESLNTIIQFAN
jgi:hypothetical protein